MCKNIEDQAKCLMCFYLKGSDNKVHKYRHRIENKIDFYWCDDMPITQRVFISRACTFIEDLQNKNLAAKRSK
jgi:hypothetical protein